MKNEKMKEKLIEEIFKNHWKYNKGIIIEIMGYFYKRVMIQVMPEEEIKLEI